MNATWKKLVSASVLSIFLPFLACENSKTHINREFSTYRNRASGPDTQVDPAEIAKRKAGRLYEALTGTKLLDNNPLKADLVALVLAGKMKEAAQKITHRYNGAKHFYNNVVKNFATPINRTHSMDENISDITALFIGIARDDGTIDDLLYGNFYYFDPATNNPSSGNPQQRAYPGIFRDNGNGTNLEHYDYLDQKGSLRDELVRETRGSTDIGVFTTHAWARAYYDAGTHRRSWKGIVEHFFCQDHPNIKTIYIPYDFIRRDVTRAEGGVPDAFLQNCTGCHAQMDPLSNAFQMFDYDTDNLILSRKDTFSEKINNPENFPAGYTPTSDEWWLYTTDSQEQLLGFRNVAADTNGPAISFNSLSTGLKMATGKGLKDLARTIAYSKGFAHCLAERIVLQLVHKKVWSLATINESDRTKLEADKALVDEIANELLTTRKFRKAFESVAIKYAERE